MAMQKPVTACVYCGQVKPTTSEYFVPSSLFDKKPQQGWTIPVCDPCNHEKANSDDYLRDMLIADDSCGWHPVAQALMRKMLRSARRGSSLVAKSARNAKQSSMYSPGSVYMGDLLPVPLEDTRLARIFIWLVRGAYSYLLKQRIPDDYTFKYMRVDKTRAGEMWALFAARANPISVQGRGVFGCTAMTLDSDPFTSIWLLGFYQWLETADLAALPSSREYMPFYDRGITYQVEVSKPGSGLDWEDASSGAQTRNSSRPVVVSALILRPQIA